MMLALLVYGYATGVFSSRKIDRATYDSVAFRYIAAELHPDHDTLANFRKTFLVEVENLFVQVRTMAQPMKLVKVGQISLDGTKVKANASKHKALSNGHIEKLEKQLREEVQALLQRAAEADQEELADGMDLPDEIARREDRLKALGEAKAKIAERVKARDEQAQKEYEEKVARREAQRAAGEKPKGREPQAPKTGPQAKDQINLTDEESRIMPSVQGFVQSYNAQAAVDADTMLVLAATVTQEPNDKQQVEPMLQELAALPEELGQAEVLLADSGYFSQSNVEACASHNLSPLIAAGRERHHPPLAERLAVDPVPPATADPVSKMIQELKTRKGRALYGRRRCTVEPVFGIINPAMGFRQFSLRGLQAVSGEWKLVTMAFNLKRLHVLATA
jgi:predicted house-cleaning noncanonical NTP pyrophosphatase (MazG superfamily)